MDRPDMLVSIWDNGTYDVEACVYEDAGDHAFVGIYTLDGFEVAILSPDDADAMAAALREAAERVRNEMESRGW